MLTRHICCRRHPNKHLAFFFFNLSPFGFGRRSGAEENLSYLFSGKPKRVNAQSKLINLLSYLVVWLFCLLFVYTVYM